MSEQKTPRQWLWGFRDHCFSAAQSAGVDNATVNRVMERVKAGPEEFPLGPGMVLKSQHELNRLPEGSVVYVGRVNDRHSFGVFRFRGGRWEHLVGHSYMETGRGTTVHLMPGVDEPPDWVTEQWDESMVGPLAQLKAKCWRSGWKEKIDHGWCPSYESYLSQYDGLDASVLSFATFEGITVGEKITSEQARVLPVGSVLRWRSRTNPDERWSWFIRDDSMTNEAQTRMVFCKAPANVTPKNYAANMRVVHIPTEDTPHITVPPPGWGAIIDHVPPGTVLAPLGQRDQFVVSKDHRINNFSSETPASGPWLPSNFDNPDVNLQIVRFP